jgi:cephalosporin hydroxylase
MTATEVLPAPPVPMLQSPAEIGALWDHVAARPHSTVVEIGSLYGGTLWGWLHLPDVEEVVSVDQITDWDPPRTDVIAARAEWSSWPGADRLRVVEADSHHPSTVTATRVRAIDFLFIDGDHTYEGVRADFDLWSPLVRPGGTVAFHDTVPTDWAHEPGVVQIVNELKPHLRSVEWFAPEEGGVGITAFEIR